MVVVHDLGRGTLQTALLLGSINELRWVVITIHLTTLDVPQPSVAGHVFDTASL
jgi:hypothetical protein